MWGLGLSGIGRTGNKGWYMKDKLNEIAEWFNQNIGECTHDGCVIWFSHPNEKEYWRKIMELRHIVVELNKAGK